MKGEKEKQETKCRDASTCLAFVHTLSSCIQNTQYLETVSNGSNLIHSFSLSLSFSFTERIYADSN